MWCSVRFDLEKDQAPTLGGHQRRSSSIAVVQNSYSNNMVVSIVDDITDDAEGHETVLQTWLLTENCFPCYLHRILEHDAHLYISVHFFLPAVASIFTAAPLELLITWRRWTFMWPVQVSFQPCKVQTADSNLVQYSCVCVNCRASPFCLSSYKSRVC